MLFVTVWILKNIHVDSKKSRRNRKQKELLGVILNCPEMYKDLSSELAGLDWEELAPDKHSRWWQGIIDLFPILLLLVAFIGYGIVIWTTDFSRAVASRIILDDQSLHQGIFLGLSLAIFFSYILMATWFRLFQLNSYQSNIWLTILAVVSYAVIIVIGIVYSSIVLADVDSGTRTVAITAFCVIPLYIFTIWIFYGIWMPNLYNLYGSSKLTQIAINKEKERNEAANEEGKEEGKENPGQMNSNDQIVEPNRQNKKDKKKVTTKYHICPRYFNDVIIVLAFWINIIGVFAGFVICVIEYEPRWIIAFIWAWMMMAEFGAMGVLRFVHHGYSRKDEWMWICIWTCIAFYICSVVSFIFGITEASDDDESSYIIAFLAIHIGVLLLLIYLTLGYKIKQEIKKNSFAKVCAIIGLIITLAVIGILLIFLAEYYASGIGLLTLCVYLLLKLIETQSFMSKWLSEKWWNILELTILTILVIAVMIVLLILLDDKSQAALEVVSYAMYLLVVILSIMFYLENRKNEEAREHQIYVYSTQLLPMLKYETGAGTGHGGKMVQNNSEYFYFFSATLLFLAWSLLAGMLLDEDHRYIGLGLTSLIIIIGFLYIIRNYNRANYFK
jgi:hypothetical protein